MQFLILPYLILSFIIVIWAIIDVYKTNIYRTREKGLWAVFIFFLPMLGSLIYFQVKGRNILKERKKFQPNFNR